MKIILIILSILMFQACGNKQVFLDKQEKIVYNVEQQSINKNWIGLNSHIRAMHLAYSMPDYFNVKIDNTWCYYFIEIINKDCIKFSEGRNKKCKKFRGEYSISFEEDLLILTKDKAIYIFEEKK